MSATTQDWTELQRAIASLREEVAGLGRRLATLESAAAAPAAPARPAARPAAAAPAPAVPAIDEATLAVISAALAAYFGKRPHVRQIRLLGSAAWAQEGRLTIQASHARVRKG